jgi:hypothetical protein
MRTFSDPVSTQPAVSHRRSLAPFVLAGGGSLGAMQVGMLRGLYERGVTPDLLLVGGGVVSNPCDRRSDAIARLAHGDRMKKRSSSIHSNALSPRAAWAWRFAGITPC